MYDFKKIPTQKSIVLNIFFVHINLFCASSNGKRVVNEIVHIYKYIYTPYLYYTVSFLVINSQPIHSPVFYINIQYKLIC